jgi:4-carboxymuconolactone decarboxylase
VVLGHDACAVADHPFRQHERKTKDMKNDDVLGGRLPLVDVAQLTAAQGEMLNYLEETKFPWAEKSGFQARVSDGRVIGPFNIFPFGPEMGRAFNDWTDAESAHTSLAPDVRQVVILTVAAAWHAAYETYAHVAVARTAGVDEATITKIRAGQEPQGASETLLCAWRFTHELVETRAVSSPVFNAAKARFGDRGLVDMLHLIGIYLAGAALMNALEVPAPE